MSEFPPNIIIVVKFKFVISIRKISICLPPEVSHGESYIQTHDLPRIQSEECHIIQQVVNQVIQYMCIISSSYNDRKWAWGGSGLQPPHSGKPNAHHLQ